MFFWTLANRSKLMSPTHTHSSKIVLTIFESFKSKIRKNLNRFGISML